MKLTTESHKLMSYFIKENMPQIKQTHKTDTFFSHLLKDITDGVSYVSTLNPMYTKKYIESKTDIIKPSTFDRNAFPRDVINHIYETANAYITFTIPAFEVTIKIIFIIEQTNISIKKYNEYVETMLVWLYIVNKYCPSKCFGDLTVYVYHTSLLKVLPDNNHIVLDEVNVNTAFTRTCPTNAEIVIFRREEWFKVFIHETFHNYNMDFSGMNIDMYNQKILEIFRVKSDVNLYEAYTECWARIMNVLFCSYFSAKKNNINDFLTHTELFMNMEISFSFFQMEKTLQFMGLTYADLYSKSTISKNALYKEKSNILSYYIISTILLYNYQDLLVWCHTNNENMLCFKKTHRNLNSFCKFIEIHYRKPSFLERIQDSSYKKNNSRTMLVTMRMTVCELI